MTTGLANRDDSATCAGAVRGAFPRLPGCDCRNGPSMAISPRPIRLSEQLFGYSETELIGNLVEILIPERFRGHHPQHRGAYVAAPSARPMGTGLELYGRRKDGTEFPVDIMLSPVEASGEQSVLTVMRDITERKQAETALRRSEERFRLLVEGASDYAIFMLDPEGRVATWNSGAERIKGYRAEEILGQHFSKFYPAGKRRTRQTTARVGSSRRRRQIRRRRMEDPQGRLTLLGQCDHHRLAREGRSAHRIFQSHARLHRSQEGRRVAAFLNSAKQYWPTLTSGRCWPRLRRVIQRLIPHDYASIALYDVSSPHQLQVQELSSAEEPSLAQEAILPIEGTPEGWVFTQPGTASDEPNRRQEGWSTGLPTQGGNQVGLLGSSELSR